MLIIFLFVAQVAKVLTFAYAVLMVFVLIGTVQGTVHNVSGFHRPARTNDIEASKANSKYSISLCMYILITIRLIDYCISGRLLPICILVTIRLIDYCISGRLVPICILITIRLIDYCISGRLVPMCILIQIRLIDYCISERLVPICILIKIRLTTHYYTKRTTAKL